jgi:hypothetical protein
MNSIRQSSPSGTQRPYTLTTAMLGMFTLLTSTTSWAALRAELEPATVQFGSTLTLSIESDGAQPGMRPEVTPLRKDFDVLGTSTSSETTFINGSRSDRTRWLVRLQPRHTGIIDIPPISVGGEHTAALQLNVTDPSPAAANADSKHVFLEAGIADPGKSIYVQQQIPYTVRLYYDDTLQSGELAAPDPADAIVEQLGEDKRYTAMRDGRQYNVIERHYAVAPEKSGVLHIPPASFEGMEESSQHSQGDAGPAEDVMARLLRDTPFANDPFFKGGLGANMTLGDPGRQVAARSPEIALDVQPRPAAAKGIWLPAEQITLHDSWEDNPPQLKVGEPVTRTITIDAKGSAASQIPPLSLAQPANARMYPETPDNQSRTDGNVVYGVSKQSVTYIPTAPGTLDIPAVELAWWNTSSNAPALAALPSQELKVEAGVATGQPNMPTSAPTSAVAQPRALAVPVTAAHPTGSASLTERLQSRWAWFAGGVALLAIVMLSAIAIQRSRRSASTSDRRAMAVAPGTQRRATMRALHQACIANNRYAAAHALLELARVQWPDDPPRGLSALAERLEVGGVELVALDRSLYGTGGSHWDGRAFWDVLRRGLRPKRSESWRGDEGIAALYR